MSSLAIAAPFCNYTSARLIYEFMEEECCGHEARKIKRTKAKEQIFD
jgi:hypothetical protein